LVLTSVGIVLLLLLLGVAKNLGELSHRIKRLLLGLSLWLTIKKIQQITLLSVCGLRLCFRRL